MSVSYSEVPPGGVMSVPPAIPTGMLYRVKQIGLGVSKQTLKIVPLSGQTTATNGQKVIVSLPPNSLVDLSTFEMNIKCGHARRFGSPSAGSGPRLYCVSARPFAAAGHDPGPD